MNGGVRAFHLPGAADIVTQRLRIGAVDVDMPELDAVQLCTAIAAIKDAALQLLRPRPLADILALLDRVVTNWLNPEYPLRRLAEQILPKATGFSPAMVTHALPLLFEPLRAPAIGVLLENEIGDRRCRSPVLITHVLSGNIPGLAATPIMLSLALGSATLVKAAAGDPIFPALFARSISDVDETLGRCLAVAHWRGGVRDLEDVAFGAADLVVASGSDAAIAAIAARVPRRFIGHGHKISFAAIGAECLTDVSSARELARRLAYDVSLWDQQGCLSPQLCYIESGSRVTPVQFAALLGESLTLSAQVLPPRQLSFEEQAEVLRFRHAVQWAGEAVTLLASRDTMEWSISVESTLAFLPTCLHRCIRVVIVDDLRQIEAVLPSHRRHLEGAGVAVDSSRISAVTTMLESCGVHHLCSVGAMQLPPLGWRQGGRPRVGDWVA